MGMTGIPIINVNNNCATGSSALYLAKNAIAGGLADCTMAVGFEKMAKGSLGAAFNDRTNPIDKFVIKTDEWVGIKPTPMAPQFFGNAALEHMEKYGTTEK
jgi:sterol carrier protein 2